MAQNGFYLITYFTFLLLNTACPVLANSADPDQLASSEANWSGSVLFVIKYVNFYQKNLNQLIWLAGNLKWACHLNLFSKARVNISGQSFLCYDDVSCFQLSEHVHCSQGSFFLVLDSIWYYIRNMEVSTNSAVQNCLQVFQSLEINLYHSMDKFMICYLLFPDNKNWHFMQIASNGDNLHEMSKLKFWQK